MNNKLYSNANSNYRISVRIYLFGKDFAGHHRLLTCMFINVNFSRLENCYTGISIGKKVVFCSL
jgi:hypothetical protein